MNEKRAVRPGREEARAVQRAGMQRFDGGTRVATHIMYFDYPHCINVLSERRLAS